MLLRGYGITTLLYMVPVFFISIAVHEFSHAYIAYGLGDPTAKNMGRLTLNPLKHLDILGVLMFLLAGIGWAKPVPVNAMHFKDKRKGILLTSLSGPLSNILLAFIFAFPMHITAVSMGYSSGLLFSTSLTLFSHAVTPISIVFNLSRFFYIVNIMLAVFNLLPVPPLDGSKILSVVLPPKYYFKMLQYENYIVIILLLLVFALPGILFTVMSPLIWSVETAIRFIVMNTASLFL